jgi:N-acetylglucosamine-6-sulfatase
VSSLPKHRRTRILLPILLLLVLAAGLIAAKAPIRKAENKAAQPNRPNIVFILTDDQDVLLGSLDVMPAVRNQIAAQGLTFTNAFVPLSLCCPSRSTILTGQYAHNHQVYTNVAPDGGFHRFLDLGREKATIGTAMKNAGYRTALMGKYLNEYPRGAEKTHVPPGWDEWDVPIGSAGYNQFNYTLNQNGRFVAHGNKAEDYLTDVLTERARLFIRDSAARGTPFFLYVAPYAPHRPATPAPRHALLFPDARAPHTASFNEADMNDKPKSVRKPLLTTEEIGILDYQYRRRLQSLQAVNDMVLGIVRTLKNMGQLDNTYIVFTSDNGFHLGQHRMKAGKYTPYEEDIRVPLVVRGPGVPAGSTTSAFVLNVDFAPTFAELGGARLGVRADGRSFVPLLRGGPVPADWRKAVFLEQFAFRDAPAPGEDAEGNENIDEPSDRTAADGVQEYFTHLGLRTPTYKYVERANHEFEYYDLVNDPAELRNLAAQMSPQLRGRLSEIVNALSTCDGADCRRLDAQTMP